MSSLYDPSFERDACGVGFVADIKGNRSRSIIDDGLDQRHPYFSPAGYTMPFGFPKGQKAYTTAKVIVARAFAPAGTAWPNALKPFDPLQSEHATHVAGIAAGNADRVVTHLAGDTGHQLVTTHDDE